MKWLGKGSRFGRAVEIGPGRDAGKIGRVCAAEERLCPFLCRRGKEGLSNDADSHVAQRAPCEGSREERK